MTDNVKDSYEKVAQAASAAASDAGKLAVDSLEKLIELQMGAVRTYADAVLSNAREALEIKDADAARTYSRSSRRSSAAWCSRWPTTRARP